MTQILLILLLPFIEIKYNFLSDIGFSGLDVSTGAARFFCLRTQKNLLQRK